MGEIQDGANGPSTWDEPVENIFKSSVVCRKLTEVRATGPLHLHQLLKDLYPLVADGMVPFHDNLEKDTKKEARRRRKKNTEDKPEDHSKFKFNEGAYHEFFLYSIVRSLLDDEMMGGKNPRLSRQLEKFYSSSSERWVDLPSLWHTVPRHSWRSC